MFTFVKCNYFIVAVLAIYLFFLIWRQELTCMKRLMWILVGSCLNFFVATRVFMVLVYVFYLVSWWNLSLVSFWLNEKTFVLHFDVALKSCCPVFNWHLGFTLVNNWIHINLRLNPHFALKLPNWQIQLLHIHLTICFAALVCYLLVTCEPRWYILVHLRWLLLKQLLQAFGRLLTCLNPFTGLVLILLSQVLSIDWICLRLWWAIVLVEWIFLIWKMLVAQTILRARR